MLPPRVLRLRRAAQITLFWEKLWPAVWPAFAVAGTLLCLALLNVPRMLPPVARLGLLAVGVAAIIGLLVWRVRRLRWPSMQAAERRLEEDSKLPHRPLAVLRDHPSQEMPGEENAGELWDAHQRAARDSLRGLRMGWPRSVIAASDRFGLHGLLLVVLVVASAIAGADAPGRIASLFAVSPGNLLPSLQIQGWITPPDYTGLPPVLLPPGGGALSVPSGGHLHVDVSGTGYPPSLALDGRAITFHKLDRGSWQAEQTIPAHADELALKRWFWPLADWQLNVLPDQPPTVSWVAPPAPTRAGTLRLPWHVTDDYGVTGLHAIFRLQDRASAPVFALDLPLPGQPKNAQGAATPDLTPHPWAGLPVTVMLQAQDGAGQHGDSTVETLVLPEHKFRNPLAQLLMQVRKELSRDPSQRSTAEHQLVVLASMPRLYGDNSGIYLNLSAMISLLARDRGADAVDQAQQRMWAMAVALDDDSVSRTRRALDEALKQARETKDPSALQQRIHDLQRAIQQHLQALAQQQSDDGAPNPQARQVTGDELQQLAQQAEDAAKRGDMAQSARDLANLEQTLRNLRAAPSANSQARAAARQRAQQMMAAMQGLLQRQAALLDHSRSRQSGQPAPGDPSGGDPSEGEPDGQGNNQPGSPPGTQPGTTPSQSSDAAAQQGLRRELGGLMQRLAEQNGSVPGALGEAELAMRNAITALGNRDDAGAGHAQQQAVEALQRGSHDMRDQMARGQPSGSGDENEGDPGQPGQQQGDRQDPLGRDTQEGTSGNETGNESLPATADAPARSRQIQDELRKRDADRTRPRPELDYIERLLRPF